MSCNGHIQGEPGHEEVFFCPDCIFIKHIETDLVAAESRLREYERCKADCYPAESMKREIKLEAENKQLQKEIKIRSKSEELWIKNFVQMRSKVDKHRRIPIAERLPKMFMNVLVYGVVEKQNICPQIWEARRFTGWSTGWPGCAEGEEPPWHWLTPTDRPVKDVVYWVEKP